MNLFKRYISNSKNVFICFILESRSGVIELPKSNTVQETLENIYIAQQSVELSSCQSQSSILEPTLLTLERYIPYICNKIYSKHCQCQ